MSVILEIKNIGGLKELVKMNFEEGLNIIKAPNTKGKSSVVKAIKSLYIKSDDPEAANILNLFSDEGYVKLIDGKTIRERIFKRKGSIVEIEKKNIKEDNRVIEIAFADPNEKFLAELKKGENIKETIQKLIEDVSEIKKLREKKEEVEVELSGVDREIEFLKKEVDKAEDRKIELKSLEKDIKDLEGNLKNLEKYPSYKENESKINAMSKSLKIALDHREDAENKVKQTQEKIEQLEIQMEQNKKEIEEIGKKDIQKEIEISQTKADKLENEIKDSFKEIDFLDRSKKQLEDILKSKTKVCPVCETEEVIKKGKKIEFSYSITTRLKDIKQQISRIIKENQQKQNLRSEMQKKIDNLQIEIREKREDTLKTQEAMLIGQINLFSSEVQKEEADFKEQDEKMKELKKKINALENDMKREKGEYSTDFLKKQERKKEKEELAEEIQKELRALTQKALEKEVMGKKRSELNEEFKKYQEEYQKRLHIARLTFNKEIKKVYNDLEFRDFTKIEIAPDFDLEIVRGKGVKQPLKTLSASERLTVGIVFLLSAYKSYLTEVCPFFVLDEVFSYDKSRFDKIVNYLMKSGVSYIVMTMLSDKENKLTVEYSI